MKIVHLLLALLVAHLAFPVAPAHAIEAAQVATLVQGDNEAKREIIDAWVHAGDENAIPVLQALLDGDLQAAGDRAFVISDAGPRDAVTGAPVDVAPDALDKVRINNRLRARLAAALATLRLSASDARTRLAAALALQSGADPEILPIVVAALNRERDVEVAAALRVIQATLYLGHIEASMRLQAVHTLSQHPSAANRARLRERLGKDDTGAAFEPDPAVRAALHAAIERIDARLRLGEYIGHAFSGLSLGSVLLLAALGLAITFGLMGIINMAHGELLMIGAYATYVVQTLFRTYLPAWFDWYLAAALPVAFAVAALVGIAMERGVIRFLYGRPLETLLATWGLSLILIQTVRLIFGAQNVEVTNPAWMSGGLALMPGLVLPHNRLVIVAFAAVVVLLVWLLLNRTRLGLFVRAVMQNRRMADCVGVPTPKVDMLAFGLGAGVAGLGGVALSQLGNVGPELGQGYIVDSFTVVVLGGVGQLAGTVVAALGLGEVNKILEPYAGAVFAKILVLVLIIVFIQKRPQGLFAMKGRAVEN